MNSATTTKPPAHRGWSALPTYDFDAREHALRDGRSLAAVVEMVERWAAAPATVRPPCRVGAAS